MDRLLASSKLWVIYHQNPNIVIREEDKEAVLLFNPDNADVKVLNTTGKMIWELYDGQRSLSEIIHILSEDFDVQDSDRVVEDVVVFTDTLMDANFIYASDLNKDQ